MNEPPRRPGVPVRARPSSDQPIKRGTRRLIVVVAVLAGLTVTCRENTEAQKRYAACIDLAFSYGQDCYSPRPAAEREACVKDAEASKDRTLASCQTAWGGTFEKLYLPLIAGGLTALVCALLLEFARFIVAWVVAGFRR